MTRALVWVVAPQNQIFFHPLIKQKWVKLELKFQGLEIRNGTNGIYIVNDGRGRPTGEAFVQFSNSEDTDLAMKKNREKIGHRSVAPRHQLGINTFFTSFFSYL